MSAFRNTWRVDPTSRRGFLRTAAVLATAGLAAACAPSTTTSPAAPPASTTAPPVPTAGPESAGLTTINYGQITVSALNWPFLIAQSRGFFAERGIELSTVIGGNTAGTSQALVSGATDIAQMNLVQHIAANAAGADLVVIAGDTMVPIYTLIVQPTIKSYADLKGQRLAVAGPTDPLNFVLARMLAANGLNPSDYEMVPIGGTPDRLAAVQKGATAGSLLTQPDDFKALAGGLGQLGQSTDYVDHFQYTETSVRKDWLKQHEDLVVQFLRAYVRATHFFYDPSKKEQVIQALVEGTKADTQAASATYDLYQKTRRTIPTDGDVDVEGARIVAQNWKDFGLNKDPGSIDPILDFSYLKQAQNLERA
jgi:ABC-type nitrate/sulfonate/bicarbonate transport system substrate-binding protein